jgi:hypothetical protein
VLRQGQERARFLAEQLQKLLLRQAARGGRIVLRHFQRERFGVSVVAFFDPARHENRAPAAAAERAHDIKGADRSARQKPVGQCGAALLQRNCGRAQRDHRQGLETPEYAFDRCCERGR